jgi:hypothetical protein
VLFQRREVLRLDGATPAGAALHRARLGLVEVEILDLEVVADLGLFMLLLVVHDGESDGDAAMVSAVPPNSAVSCGRGLTRPSAPHDHRGDGRDDRDEAPNTVEVCSSAGNLSGDASFHLVVC